MHTKLILKPGRDIPIIRGHPWVMSGAVASIEGDATADEVDILSSGKRFLGRATAHPKSDIRARVFAHETGATLDGAGIRQRLEAAFERRRRWMAVGPSAAYRLVFSESDDLPGLIVDVYAGVAVVQCLTAFWEARRDMLIKSLRAVVNPVTIWERSDVDIRRHEGIEPRQGLMWGEPPKGPVAFDEDGVTFLADIEQGHKTGFYLDQRLSRARLGAWVSTLRAPTVLNVFAYTNAFGLVAMRAGAAGVTLVESSKPALEFAAAQAARNPGIPAGTPETLAGNAFEVLRALRAEGRQFDLIVLDPPRLVARKDRLQSGLRAYKDINLVAMQLVKPGGLLFSFSCSGIVSRELFGKVLEGAGRDARRHLQVLESLEAPPDHPRRLGFPESEYLKGFVIGVG